MPDHPFSPEEEAWVRALLKVSRDTARGAASDAVALMEDKNDPLLIPKTEMRAVARLEVFALLSNLIGEAVTDNNLGTVGDRLRKALKFPETLWSLTKWVGATIFVAFVTAYVALILPAHHP